MFDIVLHCYGTFTEPVIFISERFVQCHRTFHIGLPASEQKLDSGTSRVSAVAHTARVAQLLAKMDERERALRGPPPSMSLAMVVT